MSYPSPRQDSSSAFSTLRCGWLESRFWNNCLNLATVVISHSQEIFPQLGCTCVQSLSHVWLCNSRDWSCPGSCVPGISKARIRKWENTGVGFHFLYQGIFPTQGSNLSLVHWQDSLLPSHQGSPSQNDQEQLIFPCRKRIKVNLYFRTLKKKKLNQGRMYERQSF